MKVPLAVRIWFQTMDADGDGRLSVHELRRGFERLGRPKSYLDTVATMAGADEDGDGTLSLQEVARMLERERRTPAVDEALASFRLFDLDGDGFLTGEEVHHVLDFLGIDAEGDARAWVAELDLDGDGRVSEAEFLAGGG